MCLLHLKTGQQVPCSKDAACDKFLDVDIPEHQSEVFPRIYHIMRLQALINVGCKFRLEDLDPDEWDQLIAMTAEQNILDSDIQKWRTAKEKKEKDAEPDIEKARKDAGVPAPGQSLFGKPRGRR